MSGHKDPSLKDRAQVISYALGSLGLYHRPVNRARLTTVMLHRVLRRAAWAAA